MPRLLTCAAGAMACLCLLTGQSPAQKRVAVARPAPSSPLVRDTTPPPSAAKGGATRAGPEPARFRPLTASSFVLSRLDDNVNRDSTGVPSIGMITGLSGRLESGPARPWLTLEYDVAFHRYSATTRYNRVSQRGRSTIAARPLRWWTLDLVTEGALKGSSEDRDVSDQLAVQPRSEFRLGGGRRLRLVGAQRWRRFPDDTLQDARNRFVAAEFRHRFAEGGEFETEARVEVNDATGARFDYRRTTFATVYLTPLGSHATLELEMQYRIQAYPGRLVEIDDQDYRRRDHRLEPAAAFAFRAGAVTLELSYEPEWRRSNDPTKSVDQHVLLFGLRRRW